MKFIAVLALAAVAHAEPVCDYEQDPNNPYNTICVSRSGCSCPSWWDTNYVAIAGALYAGRYNSAGYTRPYGNGGYYYGKRSADAEPEANAEADPALLYGAYGYGLPYSGVYRSYGAYPYGYRTYGAYPYAYYGKRSADYEPEAPNLYAPYKRSADYEPQAPNLYAPYKRSADYKPQAHY